LRFEMTPETLLPECTAIPRSYSHHQGRKREKAMMSFLLYHRNAMIVVASFMAIAGYHVRAKDNAASNSTTVLGERSRTRWTQTTQVQFDLVTQCEGDFKSQSTLMRPDYTDFIFSWAAIELILFNSQSPVRLSQNDTARLKTIVLNGGSASQNDPRIQVNVELLPSFVALPRTLRVAFATAVCTNTNETVAGSSSLTVVLSTTSAVSGLPEFCQTFLQSGTGSKTVPRKSFIPFQDFSIEKQNSVAETLCMAIESRWSKVVANLYDHFQQMGYIGTITSTPVTPQPNTKPPVTTSPTTQRPVTPKPTTQQPVTPKPRTNRPVTRNPTTKRPITMQPTRHPVTEMPTTLQPTIAIAIDMFPSASPSPTPYPPTPNPTPKPTAKPQTLKPKTKPTKRDATSRPTTYEIITAKPTRVPTAETENTVDVQVKFTTYTALNPSTVVTAADIINGTDNGLLNSVIMALSQVIDQNTGDQVLNAYQRPVTTIILPWDVSNKTSASKNRRRLIDLLYSGVAYVADEPNYWISVKIPFLLHSNLSLNRSHVSISRTNNAAQTDDWFDDDGTSSAYIANYTEEVMSHAVNAAVKNGISDGTLLRLMKGLDSRIQAVEYLQEVEHATSSPQVRQFNHILPVIGVAMFAMTSMMCGGLILIARLRRIQREKDRKWRETINNEEAFHKFIEMGLTLDDNVNKFMQSSMPFTGKPCVRDGSLLVGNDSCNSSPVITAKTRTTTKGSSNRDTNR